jgi:double-stranded uracil-DNA glycosylase
MTLGQAVFCCQGFMPDSFPPIAATDARILILGTMPGVASLARGEYYAHPRNAFWTIIADLLGFSATAPYGERRQWLLRHKVALWDVLASCERAGSSDAAIKQATALANDLPLFLAEHSAICHIFLNGTTAAALLRRHYRHLSLPVTLLPSTSPALARLNWQQKREAWRAILVPLGLVAD